MYEKAGTYTLAKQYYQTAIDAAQDPYLEIYANVALNRLSVTTGADSKALLLMAKKIGTKPTKTLFILQQLLSNFQKELYPYSKLFIREY